MSESMIQEVEVVRAGPADAGLASSIMNEAATWLTELGNTLWFLEELSPEKLNPSIDAGVLYLVKVKGVAVGTVIFQLSDRLYWPDMARQAGMKYLRLDTEAARKRLCAFYESAGFIRHSERQVGRHYVVRYEMKV